MSNHYAFHQVLPQLELFVWEVSSSPEEVWIAYTAETHEKIVHCMKDASEALEALPQLTRELRCKRPKPTQTGDFPFDLDGLTKVSSTPFSDFEKSSAVQFKWFPALLLQVRNEADGPAYAKVAADKASLVICKERFLSEVERMGVTKDFDITLGAHNLHAAASWLGNEW